MHGAHVPFRRFLARARLIDTTNKMSIYLNCFGLRHRRKILKIDLDAVHRGDNAIERPVATRNFALSFADFFYVMKNR